MGPELLLVDVKPKVKEAELQGHFFLTFPEAMAEYSLEVIVLSLNWNNSDIQSNVIELNNTFYYKLMNDSLFLHEISSPAFSEKEGVLEGQRHERWILRDKDLVETLRCTRKPDSEAWCPQMPSSLWNKFFASWYTPAVRAREIQEEALELMPRYSFPVLGPDHRVCFFGDSQMRHLFNNFVMVTSNYTAIPVESASKAVMPSSLHAYVAKNWPGFNPDETESVISKHQCTTAVVNVGQWPAGWPEGFPMPFETYQEGVQSDMHYMHFELSKRRGIRTLWVATNPHGYIGAMFGPHATEWRHDIVINEYNRLARLAAEQQAIEFVDFGHIIRPLGDLAYDYAHYMGKPGDEMAKHLVRILLSDS